MRSETSANFHIVNNEEIINKIGLTKEGGVFGETVFTSLSNENVALKIGLTAFGGPILTFIQVVAQLILALTCFDNTLILCVFGISFVVPLYVFIINVIPFSFDYDGAVVYTMLSGGKKSLIASSYLTAAALIAGGVSPEELSGKLLAIYDEDYRYYNVKIIRYRYLSVLFSDENTAFLELDKINDLSRLPDGTYAEVLYELFFRALVVGDDNFIKQNKEEVLEYLDVDDTPTSLRVQVAHCIYNEEYERAKLLVDSGLKLCNSYEDKGMAKLEKQLLERFKDALKDF